MEQLSTLLCKLLLNQPKHVSKETAHITTACIDILTI